MKKAVAIAVVALVILCSAGYRYTQILPYPIGTGEESKSPNGKYIASVTNFYNEDFWGHKSNWYEFELKETSGEQIQFWKTENIPSAYFGSRSDINVIRWENDSNAVHFIFPGIDVIMRSK